MQGVYNNKSSENGSTWCYWVIDKELLIQTWGMGRVKKDPWRNKHLQLAPLFGCLASSVLDHSDLDFGFLILLVPHSFLVLAFPFNLGPMKWMEASHSYPMPKEPDWLDRKAFLLLCRKNENSGRNQDISDHQEIYWLIRLLITSTFI